jgi:vesicle transport protein SEC22
MASSCFVSVLIARSNDKFKRCSVTDSAFQQAKGQALANSLLRENVDRILERMKPVDGVQSFDFQEVMYFVQRDPTLTCIVVGNKGCTIFQEHGVNLLESAACKLLEEVSGEFLAANPVNVVMSATKPFQFLTWDRTLHKMIKTSTLSLTKSASRPASHPSATAGAHTTLMRRTAAAPAPGPSPAPNATYDALKKELQDVHGVMKQNLDDILTRGESLETVAHYSSQLKDGTQTYYKRTVHMNRMRMLQLYGPPAFVLVMILVWVWWYFL